VRTDTGERVVALTGDGGYAEYATAPAALTFPIPERVEDGQALALLLQGLTAYHVFVTTAKLAPARPWSCTRRPAAWARWPSSWRGHWARGA
jgi:NADPH:quinone reductase-like Zn-dependent oxidoreductase